MSIPAMYTRAVDGSISGVTFYVDFTPYQADVSHAGFPLLLEELKKAQPDTDRLIALTLPVQAVREAVADAVAADYLPAGVVSVTSNEIRYNDEVVTGVLVDRILTMLSEGFDIMPMVRFLENVYLNPATYARDELYLWLEKSHLPITTDGFFLAYKNVRSDYGSYADYGATDNTPGTTPSMPREQVDTVRAHTCSTGLHFCSQSYLNMYTNMDGNNVVLLKINPADVVSIPNDYGNAKGRAWKYLVLSQVEDPYARATWPSVVDEQGDDFEQYGVTDDTDDADDDSTDIFADMDEDVTAVVDARINRNLSLDTETETDRAEDFMDLMTPADAPFDATSELGKALFAACGEIGVTELYDRLMWAVNVLGIDSLHSFNDLTMGQAGTLLDQARAEKASRDAITEAHLNVARIDAINSYGIIKLRSEASKAGLKGAWKGSNKAALRAYLISQV